MIQKNQNNNQREHTPRDDAYLAGAFFSGIGLLWGWLAESAVPVVVGLCVGGLIYLLMVIAQIRHEHGIARIKAQGKVEVDKIEAYKKPSNVIEGQAVQKFPPNMMGPVAQIEAPKWTKLIEDDSVKIVARRKWMWALNNGEEARGDLIEAIVAASFVPKDEKEDLRNFIRRKYRIEFSNTAYTKAYKALQEVRAIDPNGNWMVECDAADDLLDQMREQSQPEIVN